LRPNTTDKAANFLRPRLSQPPSIPTGVSEHIYTLIEKRNNRYRQAISTDNDVKRVALPEFVSILGQILDEKAALETERNECEQRLNDPSELVRDAAQKRIAEIDTDLAAIDSKPPSL
jgi:hypothetical protein